MPMLPIIRFHSAILSEQKEGSHEEVYRLTGHHCDYTGTDIERLRRTRGGAGKGPITVGSKIDTEGGLLSQMIILLLRDNGFEVVDKSSFGPTPVVKKALESGELDLYPEYTGNGAFFFDEADSDIWKDARQSYKRVKKLDMEANNIVWLEPAPRVRGEVLDKYPEIADILGPVFKTLDLETLQALNGKIAVEGQSPADVARDYLISKGFLK